MDVTSFCTLSQIWPVGQWGMRVMKGGLANILFINTILEFLCLWLKLSQINFKGLDSQIIVPLSHTLLLYQRSSFRSIQLAQAYLTAVNTIFLCFFVSFSLTFSLVYFILSSSFLSFFISSNLCFYKIFSALSQKRTIFSSLSFIFLVFALLISKTYFQFECIFSLSFYNKAFPIG